MKYRFSGAILCCILTQLCSMLAHGESFGSKTAVAYCKEDERFHKYLESGGIAFYRNEPFSAFAWLLGDVHEGLFTISLRKQSDPKDPETILVMEEKKPDDPKLRFAILIDNKCEFGEAFFSVTNELVIAREISYMIGFNDITERTPFKEFLKIYREIYLKTVVDTVTEIDGYYSEWIRKDKIEIDRKKWSDEADSLKRSVPPTLNPKAKKRAKLLYKTIIARLKANIEEPDLPTSELQDDTRLNSGVVIPQSEGMTGTP